MLAPAPSAATGGVARVVPLRSVAVSLRSSFICASAASKDSTAPCLFQWACLLLRDRQRAISRGPGTTFGTTMAPPGPMLVLGMQTTLTSPAGPEPGKIGNMVCSRPRCRVCSTREATARASATACALDAARAVSRLRSSIHSWRWWRSHRSSSLSTRAARSPAACRSRPRVRRLVCLRCVAAARPNAEMHADL